MKTAHIYYEEKFIKTITYDNFCSESIERSFFFMKNNQNIAIVPYIFLIVFEDKSEL
jgi:hypothetical protein